VIAQRGGATAAGEENVGHPFFIVNCTERPAGFRRGGTVFDASCIAISPPNKNKTKFGSVAGLKRIFFSVLPAGWGLRGLGLVFYPLRIGPYRCSKKTRRGPGCCGSSIPGWERGKEQRAHPPERAGRGGIVNGGERGPRPGPPQRGPHHFCSPWRGEPGSFFFGLGGGGPR